MSSKGRQVTVRTRDEGLRVGPSGVMVFSVATIGTVILMHVFSRVFSK
ncbi:hypothetical protein P9112_014231 [Eukaryota sp. TZLM1-RC]